MKQISIAAMIVVSAIAGTASFVYLASITPALSPFAAGRIVGLSSGFSGVLLFFNLIAKGLITGNYEPFSTSGVFCYIDRFAIGVLLFTLILTVAYL